MIILRNGIIINYYGYRTQDQAAEVIQGSGICTPNASYELTKISPKQREPDDRVEVERNPAYDTLSPQSVN